MPCGGTYTTVKLYGNNKETPIKSLSIGYEECPPIFDITQLKDGNYSINMMACSLGGEVKITNIFEAKFTLVHKNLKQQLVEQNAIR